MEKVQNLNEGLYVEYDSGGGQWGRDMLALKAFAVGLGLCACDLEMDNASFVRIDQ